VFRIPLILGVFIALICAGTSAAAGGSTGRPDGRLVPDGVDAARSAVTPIVTGRPDGRLVPDAVDAARSAVTPIVTGRPDSRLVPDAVDARNAFPPVVIGMDGRGTISFDWLSALIGGLAVGGLALAVGGLLVLRHHGPTPAR